MRSPATAAALRSGEKVATADPPISARSAILALSHDLIGATLVSLKRVDEASRSSAPGSPSSSAIRRADPDNPRWQIDLVLALNKLALVGDEPRARFERALAILRKLDAAGTAGGQSEGLDRGDRGRARGAAEISRAGQRASTSTSVSTPVTTRKVRS